MGDDAEVGVLVVIEDTFVGKEVATVIGKPRPVGEPVTLQNCEQTQ